MEYTSQFQYAWRFVDDKYNKLPKLELDQIDELTMEESLSFWNKNINNSIMYYPISNIIKNNIKLVDDCGWGDKEKEDITGEFISNFLLQEKEMYFFWGPNHAVKTICKIFLKYWSDFCYCSDFGNIIYLSSTEIFIYHEDILLRANLI